MIRAGRTIHFNSASIASKGGVILAPIIKLHGLILRADKPIPETIKAFLLEKGVKVNRVRYKNNLFVRLMGEYKILAEAIHQFVKENTELVQAQKESLDLVSSSEPLKKEIMQYISLIENKSEQSVLSQGMEFKRSGGVTLSGDDTIVEAKESINNQGQFLSKQNIQLTAGRQIEHRGHSNVDYGIGFFAQVKAKEQIKMSTSDEINIINAGIDAGKTLLFSKQGAVKLEIDSGITWGSNPHPELNRKP